MPARGKARLQGAVAAHHVEALVQMDQLVADRRKAVAEGVAGPLKLLTESEAADLLRCSLQKVKRLRLSGKLPYLRGRPAMIEEADIHAYVEREKLRGAPPSVEAIESLATEETRLRARRSWLKHHR